MKYLLKRNGVDSPVEIIGSDRVDSPTETQLRTRRERAVRVARTRALSEGGRFVVEAEDGARVYEITVAEEDFRPDEERRKA